MHTRKWLQDELAEKREWNKHCWTSSVPFDRHSCVGYMTTAQEIFDKTKSAADLELWIMTVNRAEEYIKEKHKHRPYGKFGIQDKTAEHTQVIVAQRELIKAGEWVVKDAELRTLMTVIDNRKAEYRRASNKPELKLWKASIGETKKFLKANNRDKDLLTMELNDYQLAEKEYNKQNSCFNRCFFWCSEEVIIESEERYIQGESLEQDANRNAYTRLSGQ
jgi:hypothetical protein